MELITNYNITKSHVIIMLLEMESELYFKIKFINVKTNSLNIVSLVGVKSGPVFCVRQVWIDFLIEIASKIGCGCVSVSKRKN